LLENGVFNFVNINTKFYKLKKKLMTQKWLHTYTKD